MGDSSPCDDGTGDLNDALYSSYKTGASGNHQRLLINAVMWLAGSTALAPVTGDADQVQARTVAASSFNLFPNPAQDRVEISGLPLDESISIALQDLTGRQVLFQSITTAGSTIEVELDRSQLPAGVYLATIITPEERKVIRLVLN